MASEFTCPGCGATLRVGDGPTGRLVRCGGCVTLLRVPEPPAPEPPPPFHPPPPTRTEPSPFPPDEPAYPDAATRVRQLRILVLLVLGAFGAAFCGGLLLVGSGPEWRTVEHPAGGFRVDLPGDPREDVRVPGLKPDHNAKTLGARTWGRREDYVVRYADVPRARRADDVLDAAAKDVGTGREVRRIVRSERVTASGFPAREVEFTGRNGGTYVVLLVLADTRMYTLVAGGKTTRPGDENVRRFLDSFEVTDDRLRVRAERDRLKAAGAAAAAAGFQPAAAELDRQQALEERRDDLRAAGAAVGAAVGAEAGRAARSLPVAPAPRPARP